MRTKETILKEIIEQDSKNLRILHDIQKWQISKVISHYQTYVNRFINIDKEDLDNLYKSINDR
tara:strand:+ start:11703 stop:11891 length:189 start_codon:yes stop_codon:yes gene_type:complete